MHSTRLDPRRPDATGAISAIAAVCCPACGSADVRIRTSRRHRCTRCGTIWLPHRRGYTYDETYPAARGHHDPTVACCKQLTLQAWLRRLAMPLTGKHVLDVGFGGGATLSWMQAQGARVFGQEPVAANRAAAVAGGIPAAQIGPELADFAGQHMDLVLYLDLFEHVLDSGRSSSQPARTDGVGQPGAAGAAGRR